MKKILIPFFFLLMLFSLVSVQAQQRQLDSLLNVVDHYGRNSVERLKTLNALSFTYSTMQLDSGIAVADRAIVLAQKLNNQRELAAALNNKAFNILYRDNNSSAEELLKQALAINMSINNTKGIADNYLSLANFNQNNGDSQKAKEFLQKDIEICQKENDLDRLAWANYYLGSVTLSYNDILGAHDFIQKSTSLAETCKDSVLLGRCYGLFIFYCYMTGEYSKAFEYYNKSAAINKPRNMYYNSLLANENIQNVYFNQGNYSKALEYSLEGLRLAEQMGSIYNQGHCLRTIGDIYLMLNQNDKALEYVQKSIKVYSLTNFNVKLGYACNLAGTIYTKMNMPDSAFYYFDKAIDIALKNNNEMLLSPSYTYLGRAYREFEKYDLALQTFQKACILDTKLYGKSNIADDLLDLAKCIKVASDSSLKAAGINPASRNSITIQYLKQAIHDQSYIETNRDAHYELSLIYEKQHDLNNALAYFKQYIVLKDSISSSNTQQSIANMQLQYESEKTTQQIALLDKERALQLTQLKNQKIIRNALLIGFALLSLLAGVTYNRYRLKQRSNEQLSQALTELKDTQEQLIKSEKMAAFGVMASRVAHEIQNPLNFVNNFSELCEELIEDIMTSTDEQERKESAATLVENVQKINFHGRRAESIVKQLQEHTRSGTAHQYFEPE